MRSLFQSPSALSLVPDRSLGTITPGQLTPEQRLAVAYGFNERLGVDSVMRNAYTPDDVVIRSAETPIPLTNESLRLAIKDCVKVAMYGEHSWDPWSQEPEAAEAAAARRHRAWTHPVLGHISGWNVSQVTDMRGLFINNPVGFIKMSLPHQHMIEHFNEDISRWDVSNVTDMSFMFWFAEYFNQPIGQWNTGKVRTMRGMFSNAKRFNKPINTWDVSQVTDMRNMFERAEAFNQDIREWKIKPNVNVKSMFLYSGLNPTLIPFWV